MNFGLIKSAAVAALILSSNLSSGHAQSDGQDDLFQKYQAMVIVEEANQHCPLLSRLEAEVLNGQIVFSNDSFSGKLDMVEKFKKEARIFARRTACDAPEIMELVGIARQHATDSLVNHMLLARQIHLLDEQDRAEEKIQSGLLLSYLNEEEWALLDNLYNEVKDNYLSQASEEAWDAFESSIIKVAEERTALNYLKNETLLSAGKPSGFENAKAMADNRGITSYYHYLEKSVRAFVEGASAEETGYPFSRPANDFTNWLSYRPRSGDINWVVSYPGCGANNTAECTLFTGPDDEIGIVLNGDIDSVTLEFRNPDDDDFVLSNKTVEGPIGSNELHQANRDSNLNAMLSSSGKKVISASSSENDRFLAQSGTQADEDASLFIFPPSTLGEIEKLHKNDLLRLTVEVAGENDHSEREYIIPVHNYHRAKNWAYTIQ